MGWSELDVLSFFSRISGLPILYSNSRKAKVGVFLLLAASLYNLLTSFDRTDLTMMRSKGEVPLSTRIVVVCFMYNSYLGDFLIRIAALLNSRKYRRIIRCLQVLERNAKIETRKVPSALAASLSFVGSAFATTTLFTTLSSIRRYSFVVGSLKLVPNVFIAYMFMALLNELSYCASILFACVAPLVISWHLVQQVESQNSKLRADIAAMTTLDSRSGSRKSNVLRAINRLTNLRRCLLDLNDLNTSLLIPMLISCMGSALASVYLLSIFPFSIENLSFLIAPSGLIAISIMSGSMLKKKVS